MSVVFRVSAAGCLALLMACASTNVQWLERRALPPQPVSSIAVLETAPARPYRGLARIEVRDRGLGRSEERLRKKLMAKAAEIGADAVITEPVVTRRAFGWFVLFDDKVLAGTAVVYVEET